MSRNGLIILLCLLCLAQITPSFAQSYLNDDGFKYFKEGVAFLKENNLRKALSSFEDSLDEEFLLKDYSHLFAAVILKRQNRNKKALSHLTDIARLDHPSSVIRSKRLFGQIYLEHGFVKESFSAFDYYFGRHAMDRKASSIFPDFTKAYLALDPSEEGKPTYMNYLFSFLKSNSSSIEAHSPPLLYDILHASDSFKLLKAREVSMSREEVFRNLREDLLWQPSYRDGRLNWMKDIAQSRKDYPLKLKILAQMKKLTSSKWKRARLDFIMGLALININREAEAIKYFYQAAKASRGSFFSVKSSYYIGRSYEFLGNLSKAALYYRKAKKARYRTQEDIELIIKSVFRAGWVNYRVRNLKRAALDFGYIQKKFGNRIAQEGYSYWYGRTLLRQGKRRKAKRIFEAYYSDYPVSYYGLMCARELKKVFGKEVELDKFAIDDFVNKISDKNRILTQRALLLFISGLPDFAKEEMKRIRVNYRNTKELYIIATIYMLLDVPRKTISLVDFLINQKIGIPDEDILKIYYPLKFMDTIEAFSKKAEIDPFMIVSLIRQESVFHVKAISRANAMGLMQLMPSLGLKLARSLELGDIRKDELFEPEVNIKIGITHFAELMKKFDNNFIYSIAAYNSSEKKVKEWRHRFKTKDIYEFIENIPYYETRKYVKRNIRNYLNYQRIYTDRNWVQSLPY